MTASLSRLRDDRSARQLIALMVALVVTLRIGLGLAGYVTLRIAGPIHLSGAWSEEAVQGTSGGAALLAPWQRWDALWFQHIAEHGYRSGGQEAAFHPLYPATVRLASLLIGGSVATGALIVSTIALIAALLLLQRLVAHDVDRPTADRTVLYLAIAPTAFFLLSGHSESLFLLLVVGSIFAARRRSLAIAGVLAALAALTRIVGVLLVVPLLVEVIADVRARLQGRRHPVALAHVAALLLPLVAGIGYALYADQNAAQRSWGTHVAPVWSALYDGVARIGGDPVEIATVAAMLVALAAVPLAVCLRQPPSYIAYAAVSVIPVCFLETVDHPQSSSRFLLVVFPVFVALAQLGRRPAVHRAIVIVSLAGLLILFVHSVRGSFVA